MGVSTVKALHCRALTKQDIFQSIENGYFAPIVLRFFALKTGRNCEHGIYL